MEFLTLKVKLIIAAIVLLILIVVIFIFYRKGKNAGATNVNLVSGNADTGGVLASDSEIKELSQQIYNDLGGLNAFGSHTIDVYTRVLSLSDTDLTRLYNVFDMAHASEKKGSLVNWVNDDYAIPYSQWASTKETLLNRFAKLNFV